MSLSCSLLTLRLHCLSLLSQAHELQGVRSRFGPDVGSAMPHEIGRWRWASAVADCNQLTKAYHEFASTQPGGNELD